LRSVTELCSASTEEQTAGGLEDAALLLPEEELLLP